jgi:hypothetical protein
MKSKLLKLVFALASAGACALPVMAESMILKVPFAFRVGSKLLPAGSYMVESSGSTLYLRGAGTGMFINTIPAEAVRTDSASASFTRDATGEMLESVKFASGSVQMLLPAGSVEPIGVALARH